MPADGLSRHVLDGWSLANPVAASDRLIQAAPMLAAADVRLIEYCCPIASSATTLD